MYTFHSLSDADFEQLAGDLISHKNLNLQCFAAGRDSGIDMIAGAQIFGSTVVQCKHYLKSGLTALQRDLKTKELPKIRKLNPSRYILATSVTLTPKNKTDIVEILMPYCNGINDIYGADDLNALLREYPGIETTHYKLWLTSTAVLQRILHQGTALWNAITREQIERKVSLYVQSQSYNDALEILEKFHYCIISGIPGVGKTTLAQILSTAYLDKGFELISVRNDISEAIQSIDPTKLQVVYYDDFLGRASIGERLGKNEDQGILSLFHAAQQSENLRVIFTTREYILRDAQRYYERLGGETLELAKCTVRMEDYSRVDRAKILYNHLYFSDLPSDFIQVLLKQDFYKNIIDHPNYNPRIVEWLTQTQTIASSQTDQYCQLWQNALDHPGKIWEHAFNHQITEDARFILFCLASIVGLFDIEHLRTAWAKAVELPESPITPYKENDRFPRALKQLDGSFVTSLTTKGKTAIDFHNPSVRDYVTHQLVQSPGLLRHFVERSAYFEQIDCLIRLDRTGRVQPHVMGLVPDDLELRQAVLRTFNAESPLLNQAHYSFPTLHPLAKDAGERLATLSQWTSAFGRDWIDFICESLPITVSDKSEYATAAVCEFLKKVIELHPTLGGKFSDLVKSLTLSLKANAKGFTSVDEWMTWSKLVLSYPTLLTNEEMNQIHDDAVLFCEEEVHVLISNSDSVSQAESWFEEVEELSALWDIDLTHERRLLQDALESIEHKDIIVSKHNDRSGFRRNSIHTQHSDAEIEHLFGMLLDRAGEK